MVKIAEVEDAFLRTYGRSAHSITFRRHCCLIRKTEPAATGREARKAGRLIVPRGNPVPHKVGILAYVSSYGEVFGADGFVNIPDPKHGIVTFALEIEGNLLEFRGRLADGSWTRWTSGYSGLMGKTDPLTGFAVRTAGSAPRGFDVRMVGRFADVAEPVIVEQGQDCMAGGNPLLGMQIDLVDHRQTG